MKIVDIKSLKGKTVSRFTARDRKAPFTTEYIVTCEDGTTYTLKHKADALETAYAVIERIDGFYHIPEPVIRDGHDALKPCYEAMKGVITHAEQIALDWEFLGAESRVWRKKTLFLIATVNGVVCITFTIVSYDIESPALIVCVEGEENE